MSWTQRRARSLGTLALAALLLAAVGGGQTARAETPEQVALQYFDALRTSGMASAPRFLHPAELAKFKEMLLPIYRAEAAAGKSDLARATFGDDVTLAGVEAADPAAFASGLLKVLTSEAQQAGEMRFDEIAILGRIEEKPDIVHVLARTTVSVGDLSVTDIEVISFRPHGETWRMLLSGELQGLAQALRASLGQ